LLRAGNGYRQWTALKRQAVDYAREEFHRMGEGIRIYDTSLKGGALSDMASISSVVRRDMRLYGGNWFALDHQGLVDERGEIYEHTRSVSKSLQRLSRIQEP